MKTDITAATVDKAATVVGSSSTYGGFAAAIYGWFTSADAAILIGVIFTIAGFLVTYYSTKRRTDREAEEHEWKRQEHLARMRAYRNENSDSDSF